MITLTFKMPMINFVWQIMPLKAKYEQKKLVHQLAFENRANPKMDQISMGLRSQCQKKKWKYFYQGQWIGGAFASHPLIFHKKPLMPSYFSFVMSTSNTEVLYWSKQAYSYND